MKVYLLLAYLLSWIPVWIGVYMPAAVLFDKGEKGYERRAILAALYLLFGYPFLWIVL